MPRHGNDRLLLGLKGSLNEYELDLLRQRSLSARYEKARRGELVVSAPVGFVKAGDHYEKDPDRRVQEAITIAPAQFDGFVRGYVLERHPGLRREDHAHMIEGLRKAGWVG